MFNLHQHHPSGIYPYEIVQIKSLSMEIQQQGKEKIANLHELCK